MIERPFVLDASVAMAWCFAGEGTAGSDAARDRLGRTGAVVPGHWPAEIEHGARRGERRGRATAAQIDEFLRVMRVQLIEIEVRPLSALGYLLPLARQYEITTYDAAYLELASRRGLPLATLDAAMHQVAQKLGIDLLDLG
jgi:predicted nucleic acid-binding protein